MGASIGRSVEIVDDGSFFLDSVISWFGSLSLAGSIGVTARLVWIGIPER